MEYLEKIKNYIIKNKKVIAIITSYIFIIILFLTLLIFISNTNKKKIESLESKSKLTLKEDYIAEEEKVEYVFVDVKGAVKNPGVYEIEVGNRVNDAIIKAGGINKDANTRYINLSKIITDEMVIVVYTKEEISKILEESAIEKETPCVCETIVNEACIEDALKEDEGAEDTLININTADIDLLMTLAGIGESKAMAIIDYREKNGQFTTIEDIMKVSGISESTYSKIKDFITIR